MTKYKIVTVNFNRNYMREARVIPGFRNYEFGISFTSNCEESTERYTPIFRELAEELREFAAKRLREELDNYNAGVTQR